METYNETLKQIYTQKNYDRLLFELVKLRHIFIDERYPRVVHGIVSQIDEIFYLHTRQRDQERDLVIRNLLGVEKGKLHIGKEREVLSLVDTVTG